MHTPFLCKKVELRFFRQKGLKLRLNRSIIEATKGKYSQIKRRKKQMKKALRAIKEVVLFVLGYDCDTRRQAVNEGLIDLSGQGRDKYGN